jgi:Protein of unknown function (DUF1559)
MLLPAIQKVREAANRMKCAANRKQLGLAMHNYHDSYGKLPPQTAINANNCCYGTWQMAILPFVEQNGLWQAYSNYGGKKPSVPTYEQNENLLVTSTRLSVFTCPSDIPNAAKSRTYANGPEVPLMTEELHRRVMEKLPAPSGGSCRLFWTSIPMRANRRVGNMGRTCSLPRRAVVASGVAQGPPVGASW